MKAPQSRDHDLKKRLEFTLQKEIQGIAGLKKTIQSKQFAVAYDVLIKRKGKIVCTGVGKSAFVSMKMAATFNSLGVQAAFIHPVDALHGDSGVISNGDVVIAISFSGASPEIVRVVKHIKKEFIASVIAVTGNDKSPLATLADTVLLLDIKHEGSHLNLAPMASVAASLVVGDLLASSLTVPENFKEKHFAKFHPGGSLGLKLAKVREVMIDRQLTPVVLETASFKETVTKINDGKRGVVAVLNKKGGLLGVVTDGDIRRFLVEHDSVTGFFAKELMTRKPKVVQEDETLFDTLKLLERFKITSIFVVNKKNTLLGMVHIHDIIDNRII
jgi:arabinose-5-phosphate isomerase